MFDATPDEDEQPSLIDDDEGPVLVCRACGTTVARLSWVAAVDNGPTHRVFFNPEGVMMKVITLRATTNVRAMGVPTEEFSWFPGYAWTYAYCDGCRRQLGWRFTAVGAAVPALFWGLLETAVQEQEE